LNKEPLGARVPTKNKPLSLSNITESMSSKLLSIPFVSRKSRKAAIAVCVAFLVFGAIELCFNRFKSSSVKFKNYRLVLRYVAAMVYFPA